MAGTTFKKRDLNRYRKIYSYLRKKPSNTYYFDKPTQIETGHVVFTGISAELVTHEFVTKFEDIPAVTANAVDIYSNNGSNVNVIIKSVTIAMNLY